MTESKILEEQDPEYKSVIKKILKKAKDTKKDGGSVGGLLCLSDPSVRALYLHVSFSNTVLG